MEEIENYIEEKEINYQKSKNNGQKENKIKLLVIIVMLFSILVIASLYLFYYFTSINRSAKTESFPSPAPTLEIKNPVVEKSLWATNSAVLKTEEKIINNEKNLNQLDLNLSSLNFPTLDFNINFNKL